METQQSKFLKVVCECFENAGILLANTGCYVGKFTSDFLILQGQDNEHIHRYSATGIEIITLANRTI